MANSTKAKPKYIEGFPTERGLYRCKVDGKEKVLVHHICMNNGKHWWSDAAGYDVIANKITFCDEKLNVEDI